MAKWQLNGRAKSTWRQLNMLARRNKIFPYLLLGPLSSSILGLWSPLFLVKSSSEHFLFIRSTRAYFKDGAEKRISKLDYFSLLPGDRRQFELFLLTQPTQAKVSALNIWIEDNSTTCLPPCHPLSPASPLETFARFFVLNRIFFPANEE